MNQRSYYWVGLASFLIFTGLGCGDDADATAPDRFPALGEASALEYESDAFGVGFHHGSTVRLTPGESQNGVLERAGSVINHAFLHVSAFDAYASTYGEFLYYSAATGTPSRGPQDFRTNPDAARFEARAGDLLSEVREAKLESGADFDSYSIVLDLWNSRSSWYVPWDGKSTRAPGSFGLYRDDMRESLIAQISAVAAESKPRYFIIGNAMERFVADGEAAFSETEFSNFMVFYQDAVAAVHAASPETKVGAGINWDRFVEQVAPRYHADYESREAGAPVTAEEIDAGFQAVILPLLEAGDILSLQSYTSLDDANPGAYQFLRRVKPLYGVDKPLVWYSVGSPVTSRSGYTQQGQYLERFAQWNAGLQPEMVAWKSLMNIDGADVSSGDVAGQCRGLTGTANDFEVPLSHCFDGLFSSALQPKAVFNVLQGAIK